MSKSGWLIYGANGYTGTLVAEEALRRGHRPLLAGRSAEKLVPLARRLGLDSLAFDLSDTAALTRALEDVELVFHAAGPFIDTSDAMIRACLATGTHYLDITGEVKVFANTFGYDAQARQQGILLLSGAGFDVVPSDCLARYVAERLPSATELEIGIAGLSGVSPGTLKSMFDGGLEGGIVRRGGKLVSHPMGKGARSLRFLDKERRVMPIPWGDLESAYRSTGIPNITTYMALPRDMIEMSAATWRMTAVATPLLRGILGRPRIKEAIRKGLEGRVSGPDEAARQRGRGELWAKASDASGRSVEAWLETMEAYQLTAVAGVRAVEKTLAQRPRGALTPAQAFGADFVLEIPGSRRLDALPT